jgi:hypothetical protein
MADDSASFEGLRKAQRAARQLRAGGAVWLVYELRAIPFDRRSGSSLIFESDDTIRRVRNYPENWRELSDEELFALSWAY